MSLALAAISATRQQALLLNAVRGRRQVMQVSRVVRQTLCEEAKMHEIARVASTANRDSRVSASSCRDRFVIPGVNLERTPHPFWHGRRRGDIPSNISQISDGFTA